MVAEERRTAVPDQMRERENIGSTARDHLANERTYLAWLRTGFGTAALGIAVAELLGSPGEWEPVVSGILFIVLGLVMLVYATLRYFRVMRFLDEGIMSVSRSGPIWFGFAAVIFVAAVALLILL